MRQFFKTCKVHYCFSQELGELQPVRCRCRKFVSKEVASNLVNEGEADWLLIASNDAIIPTWDLVLKGRVGKTPRAHTIESAHMERYTERMGGNADNSDPADPEVMALFEEYHDIEMETRLGLFRGVGAELLKMKKDSDTYGNIAGESGRVLSDKIVRFADEAKSTAYAPDPFPWRGFGTSKEQRTPSGIGVFTNKKLDNIEGL